MLPGFRVRISKNWSLRMAIVCLFVLSAYAALAAAATPDSGLPYAVSIYGKGTTDPYLQSLGAQNRQMCVYAGDAANPVLYASRFDFLVCNEEGGISFVGAAIGDGLPPEWEYFTYRTDTIGTLCGTCPSNSVRLIGIASLGSGGNPGGLPLSGCVAELTYFVSSDQYYNLSCEGVQFCALDCGDNVVTSGNGDSLYLPLSGIEAGPDYDSPTCLASGGGTATPVACINYTPGAICNVDWGESGDLNLNGIGCEVGDAVLYGNYFIYGPSVWDPIWSDVQIFSSDINNDGKTLTMADLVYLTWKITGHELPYHDQNPKLSTRPVATVAFQSAVEDGVLHVRTSSALGIDGIHLVYHYAGCQPGEPVAGLPPGIVMGSSAHNGELRIAIYPDLQDPGIGYSSGENEILTIPITGQGEMRLVEAQFSDPEGQVLEAKLAIAGVPDRFSLDQNFPNPFNAATVIPYSLQEDAWVTLEIVDILGRTVAHPVDEFQTAGSHECTWRGIDADGRSVASGMYFYRLAVGDRVLTKKMVVLK